MVKEKMTILSWIVSHEEAMLLKKTGFDQLVTSYYHLNPGDPLVHGCTPKDFNNANEAVVMISAPTIEEAIAWLNSRNPAFQYTQANLPTIQL